MNQYIYVIESPRQELVTNPDAWTEDENRIAESHFAYLKKATEAGTVLLAGRSPDGEGPAIVIFEASSDEDARHFMENDPFIAEGLMTARLHPFRAALVRAA
ncbi:MAG: YciI family protein [Anaerolineaceae bacterium]|nr:YciI family protein [Anaerolineaceae bacterium]